MKRTWILAAAIPVAFLVGYLGRGGGDAAPVIPGEPAKGTVWTCSMHPQVRLPNPGKCPICEMPLIPTEAATDPNAPVVRLTDASRVLAGVETAPVRKRKLAKEIQAVGKIQFNEAALSTVTARVDGYVERLFADYTGMSVEKGDHLVELYSPDLIVAQRELLLALGEPSNPARIEASKLKLRRWDLSEEQIGEIEKTRKIQERVTLYSKVRGTIVEKSVVEKSPVKAGDVLYRVADLGSVWVHLNIYEYEIGWIQHGQMVEIAAEAFPGQPFPGMVTFVSPTLEEETRSIRVRVNVTNPERRLKPGMFVSAKVRVRLQADGRPAPTGVEGKHSCPMHPEILLDQAGPCPICGMELKQLPARAGPEPKVIYTCPMHPEIVRDAPEKCPKCGGMKLEKQVIAPASEDVLAVPVTAVLDSGTRKLVYVERAPGEFVPAEVVLGPKAEGHYLVLSGLGDGDLVAVRGNFLLDSQFQIRGLPSLMNPPGAATEKPAPPPHKH